MTINHLRSRFEDERGFAGQIFLGVVVWAVVALVLLTGILVNAMGINSDVKEIRGTVHAIDQDSSNVKLVETTNELAAGIRDATVAIPGKVDQIAAKANNIDRNVVAIDATAGSINATAKSINGTASSIRGSAEAINKSLTETGVKAGEINKTAKALSGIVSTISGHAVAIDEGLGAALPKIDALTFVLESIKGDLGNILVQLGPGHTDANGLKTIHGHANSIECSDLLKSLNTAAFSGRVGAECP